MHAESLISSSQVIFGWDPMVVSTAILVISYIILFTEKLNRAVVAVTGAAVMIFAGILTQTTAVAGIDFNTLSLLIGMMIIVGIAEKSGMFQYVAIWATKKVKANPRGSSPPFFQPCWTMLRPFCLLHRLLSRLPKSLSSIPTLI